MSSVAVVVPVLGRPANVEPLVVNLRRTQDLRHRQEIVFVCSPDDHDEIAAVRAMDLDPLIATWPPDGGDWARKINLAWRETDTEWLLAGADDLVFHPYWLDRALVVYDSTRACVIGTNDMANPRVISGQHSTHPLVHRDYIGCCYERGTEDPDDPPGILMHEGYDHWFVDDECVRTAQMRGAWAFSADSRVQHYHPNWGTAAWDATYVKGQRAVQADKALFERRRYLWDPRYQKEDH